MAEWSTRQATAALRKKGFVLVRSTDHYYYRFYVDGTGTVIRTKFSHGNKKINHRSPLFATLARQLRLNKQELSDLLSCPLDRNGYLKLVREREPNLLKPTK